MDQELKSVLDSIRESTNSYGPRLDAQQKQLDGIDKKISERHASGPSGFGGEDDLEKAFEESAQYAQLKELGKGRAVIKIKDLTSIEVKTTVTESGLGVGTSGVFNPQQVGGIVPLAQRRLFLRDLLFRGNRISTGSVFYIREQSFTNNASPQVTEGSLKGESADDFTTVQRPVATIAHWLPISRSAIDDMPALLQFIRAKLLYGLRYKEELSALAGTGVNGDLTGLLVDAAVFDTALRGSAWNKADILRRALQQVERTDEVPAGFFMIHPDDWAGIELQKDSLGQYLFSPRVANAPVLWGRPVVVSTAISSGTFLCGSSESAELIDRMDATIEISLDYEDFRARNLAMILCEERTVLCCYRPDAFVYGTLNSSPV